MKLTEGASTYAKTSLLVTNGDNVYRESFLAQMMSVPEPIAISDFAERPTTLSFDNCRETEIKLGKIDLGAFVVDIEVLRERNVRFTTSVPSLANDRTKTQKMRAYHDNDFWFISN